MTTLHRRVSAAGALWLSLAAAARVGAQVPRDSTAAAMPADSAGGQGAAGTPATPGSPAAPNAPATPPGAVLPATVPDAPPDPILARACAGQDGGGEAPGLLAVVFRPRTPDAAMAAAARAVGGTIAGESPYGETYVLIPDGAGPLPAIADRLIRQDPVTTVSPVPCPTQAAQPTAPAAGGVVVPVPSGAPVPAGTPPPAGAPPDSTTNSPSGARTKAP